jgi:hypothetical protein
MEIVSSKCIVMNCDYDNFVVKTRSREFPQ